MQVICKFCTLPLQNNALALCYVVACKSGDKFCFRLKSYTLFNIQFFKKFYKAFV